MRVHPTFGLVLVLVVLYVFGPAAAQEPVVKAQLPVLVTSSGQALDAFTVKTLLGRAGVANTYNPTAQVEDIKDAKTLVVVFGASIKGFGSAGITADTERARTEALLKAARDRKLLLVGVHIGGEDRRGGLSEQFVKQVAPAVDYLIVWQDGNADGYFTKVAEEKKIPLTLLKQPVEVGKVLARAFGK